MSPATVALTRFEGRHLLTHPCFLVGLALSVVWLVSLSESPDPDFLHYKVLVGAGVVPLAAGVGVGTTLAASRARRSRAEDLYASLPVTTDARTTAHLLSVGYAVVASSVVVGLATLFGAWDGLPIPQVHDAVDRPRSLAPGVTELAQGPAFLGLAGVLGVALGVWVRSAAAASFAIVFGMYLQMPDAFLWWSWDWQRWLLPLAPSLLTAGSIELGRGRYLVDVRGVEAAAIGWHLLYLLGLLALISMVALARSRGWRQLMPPAAVGFGAAVLGGVLQVTSAAA